MPSKKRIVFTEEFCQPENLFPFTLTRRVQDIRIGVFTIREKWEASLEMPSLDRREGDHKDNERAVEIGKEIGDHIFYLIHGNILPTPELVRQVKKLRPGHFISVPEREAIVYCISKNEIEDVHRIKMNKAIECNEEIKEIQFPWNIFQMNGWAIGQDVQRLEKERRWQKVSSTNRVTEGKGIFIEKGATVEHCYLNATEGPIHIAKQAVLMEGCMLRGPVSVGEGAVLKMGTRIYGATTIGPGCTVGGEIKNTVLFANSNKAHDGYLGDAVIGEWCNMGAGTSNSNVKNTASAVHIWTPRGQVTVGLKCGVLMGDYSRTAINTSINTGTVIGVSCNVFGNGLTPKYIPSFSWGSDGVEKYRYDKAISDIENWKGLKGAKITADEKNILKHIFES